MDKIYLKICRKLVLAYDLFDSSIRIFSFISISFITFSSEKVLDLCEPEKMVFANCLSACVSVYKFRFDHFLEKRTGFILIKKCG